MQIQACSQSDSPRGKLLGRGVEERSQLGPAISVHEESSTFLGKKPPAYPVKMHIPGQGAGKGSLKKMSELNLTPSTIPEDPSLKVSTGDGKSKKWGLFATGFVGGAILALYAIATPFVIPAFRRICLPYVPATNRQIKNVLKMLQHRSGHLVDIGSGDGRIVIAAAKKGFQAEGYELNPWLVWYSRYRAWRGGVNQNAKFHISDLWKVNFSLYTNVVIFGVPQMMPQLEKKLQRELDESARVVACRFPFPHWVPGHIFGEGVDTVWVYDLVTVKQNLGLVYKKRSKNHSTEIKTN